MGSHHESIQALTRANFRLCSLDSALDVRPPCCRGVEWLKLGGRNFLRRFWAGLSSQAPKKSPCCTAVTFAGGLGAQLLSMAVMLSPETSGQPWRADLDYFRLKPKRAVVGEKSFSVWPWQLGPYGFSFEDTVQRGFHDCQQSFPLRGTSEKLALGIRSLQRREIAALFPLLTPAKVAKGVGVDLAFFAEPFIGFHLRRGDYLNVASRVLPDELFMRTGGSLRSLTKSALVVSDSRLHVDTQSSLQSMFPNLIVLDDVDTHPYFVHQALRHASVLVGSNSQFSLVSGLLSKGLFLNPKNWHNRPSLDEVANQLGDFNAVF